MWPFLTRKAGRTPEGKTTIAIHDPREALLYTYWIERTPVRLVLPADMLRMQGAFVYDDTHPFVQALREGPACLESFYQRFTPGNIAQMYGLRPTGCRGETLPPWELPWTMRHQRKPPRGERGLAGEDGTSFYGPATPRKITLEYRRLCKVAAAIRKRGYQPDRHADIHGHFMTDGQDVCFFVNGGKHRAAALVELGNTHVPVVFRRRGPPVVDARTAEQWPLVACGTMDLGLARRILQIYLKGHHA
ncbi:MAG: hypothetical protein K9N49_00410 [Candidatus Marinimicrobia bacterium]|nr:hypothetical protein [Candidatus Neomarinimicrobiota bacterium]